MKTSFEQDLEITLHQQIPISKQMGLEVAGYDGMTLSLFAPLSINCNDKNTAFGGSLSAFTTLNGWGLIMLKMQEANIQQECVIQASNIQYLKPVTNDFTSLCTWPEKAGKTLIQSLKRKNIGRIELSSMIYQDQVAAVQFSGQYVIKVKK